MNWFENGGAAGIIMWYQGPDTGDELVVVPPEVLIRPASTMKLSGLVLGWEAHLISLLHVDYFFKLSNPRIVAVLDDLTPDKSDVMSNINIAATQSAWEGLEETDKFGAVWTGGVAIEKPGSYTFKVKSDDGSILYLDGEEVVNYNGLHAMGSGKTGTVELTAGSHTLEMR
eukprot:6309793-Amphidinium_carterae.1